MTNNEAFLLGVGWAVGSLSKGLFKAEQHLNGRAKFDAERLNDTVVGALKVIMETAPEEADIFFPPGVSK
jgi:hypothetical protein